MICMDREVDIDLDIWFEYMITAISTQFGSARVRITQVKIKNILIFKLHVRLIIFILIAIFVTYRHAPLLINYVYY